MDKKKICFVAYNMAITGGAEQVTASLANELSSFFDVYIYNINRSGNPAYELKDSVFYFPGIRGMRRLRTMTVKSFSVFLRFLKMHNIDLVISMGNYPALIVSPVRFFSKAKFVFCDHGTLVGQWKEKDITGIRFWDAISAHKVVTLTQKSRSAYIKRLHLSPGKVESIYNWIDSDLIASRQEYNPKNHKILTVGRFDPIKGYDMLLEIAQKVLPGHPDWQWHIMGEGETFEEIREKIRSRGLGDQLILLGNVPEAWKKYSEYAFLVMTSYREGLPVTLLEANAVGLPMVSFNVHTGPDEVIAHGENGYLIKACDVDKMALAIIRLMESEALRYKLAGNRINLDKFSKKAILEKWIRLVEEMYEK